VKIGQLAASKLNCFKTIPSRRKKIMKLKV
jgi:hypothetical protein